LHKGYNFNVNIEPVTLSGMYISLEPLSLDHLPALYQIGLDASLWQWTIANIGDKAAMNAYVRSALADQEVGTALPFVTRDVTSGKVVGATRFGNIDTPNRRTEIGWTWIAPPWQRTYVNTEAKLLMLTYAFEVWDCIRVEFKTDVLNERSRAALMRIGAKEEGIFRNHMITESGRFRDSVYFSIIESEWPEIKLKLKTMIES
jgi:RimJ/RimL family protein N-acetyltransferase